MSKIKSLALLAAIIYNCIVKKGAGWIVKGLLVTNHFLHWDKFDTLYGMIADAFNRYGIQLIKVTNVDLLSAVGEPCCDFFGKLSFDDKAPDFVSSFGQVNNAKPDFALFWDKDIRLAKRLEAMGIPVFNNSRALEICDDKSLTALELQNSGIIMPRTVIAPKTYKTEYPETDFLHTVARILGFPMIVKECFGSFGMQVYLVNSIKELTELVCKIGAKPMLFQEFIKESEGRDIRIHVVGSKVVAAVKRIAAQGDFRANVTNGGKMIPYKPTKEEELTAIESCRLLGVDFAGVDILFGEKPVLCEVNTNAHFKNLFDATGINVADFIASYILEKLPKQ